MAKCNALMGSAVKGLKSSLTIPVTLIVTNIPFIGNITYAHLVHKCHVTCFSLRSTFIFSSRILIRSCSSFHKSANTAGDMWASPVKHKQCMGSTVAAGSKNFPVTHYILHELLEICDLVLYIWQVHQITFHSFKLM